MLAKPTILPLDLTLVARMPPFEGLSGFTHTLATTFSAGSKVNYEGRITVYLLSDIVNFVCVCASKFISFFDRLAGMALPTLCTPSPFLLF